MSELTWDPDNWKERSQAVRIFNELTLNGQYVAFQNDQSVDKLIPDIGHVRFEKRPNRYDLLTENDHGNDCFDTQR